VAIWNRRSDVVELAVWQQQQTEARQRDALTAATSNLSAQKRSLIPTQESWQREVWDFYDELGEFRFAADWKSQMISRVRLRAGKVTPGQDEPEIVEDGPAAELVAELGGSTGGRAQMMGSLSVHFSVPGECYLVGEKENKTSKWQVRSTDEVREQGKNNDGTPKFQIIDERAITRTRWRNLVDDSMVVRLWRPHKRFYHVADSPARPARKTMRELELVNRHIISQYLSRLASAGVFVMPEEVTFPVREEFKDAPDPFVREWIEVAATAIKNPGTAASVIPIPMRVPAEYADAFKLIDFTLKIDEKLLEKRESAIRRLAGELDVPAEVLLGMGDVNHWSAWQINEDAIKAHIAPDVELMCYDLTLGYLHPMLIAQKEDPDDWVVWYDASEITQRPDKSENAIQVFDRFELSGEALRRETGFDEDDAPSKDELHDQILLAVAKDPTAYTNVLTQLGLPVKTIPAPVQSTGPTGQGEAPAPPTETPSSETAGPPGTKSKPPPPPGETPPGTEAHIEALRRQAGLTHAARFTVDGRIEIFHPYDCRQYLFSCPMTHAAAEMTTRAHPGTAGVYECWLSSTGTAIIGRLSPMIDINDPERWILTSLPSRGHNGKAARAEYVRA
jgi:hypothetical protein